MAQINTNNVRIAGMAACIPIFKEENDSYFHLAKEDRDKLIKTTGIKYRRKTNKDVCTSDLCFNAAEKLIDELNWNKSEIELLVFVSQTPDHIIPATSNIIQSRMGLGKKCMTLDLNIGCSGFVYGLALVCQLIEAGTIKKGILLTGDTISKITVASDKSTYPLFGDAGTATAIEFTNEICKMRFELNSDGTGANTIKIPNGGFRNPLSPGCFEIKAISEGISRANCHLVLNGVDIFNFSIREVPKAIDKIMMENRMQIKEIDYFVLHQANLIMNETIRKKLKIPIEKYPYSLKEYGNTSSATIPLTIISQLSNEIKNKSNRILICGFGVGLSWGTGIINIKNIICPEIIEL